MFLIQQKVIILLNTTKNRGGGNIEDINHYQKIIVALVNTDRLMKEIDEIDFMG